MFEIPWTFQRILQLFKILLNFCGFWNDFWDFLEFSKYIFENSYHSLWEIYSILWIFENHLHFLWDPNNFWDRKCTIFLEWFAPGFAASGGTRGGLEGATASLSEASSPPVGRNFEFLSEEIWQNDVRKLHFSVILAPMSEAPAPLWGDFWCHPCLLRI